MKIGIYAPYLNTYGGGEKYICKMAEILSKKYDVDFIVFEEPDLLKLEHRLNVDLNKVNVKRLKVPELFNIPKLRSLVKTWIIAKATKSYDLFLNQENHTIIPAHSQKNIYLCQVPPIKLRWPSVKRIVKNLLFDHKLETYSMIIVYSHFVKKWLEKYYPQKRVVVLSPPTDTEQFHPVSKENIILNVGRFFIGGHCKKQFEMIKIFRELYNGNNVLKDWEYHLIGGVSSNIEDQEYLRRCQKEAEGYPIYFHINAPFELLKALYGKAKIFWHATGLGEDQDKHPEHMEHFGITTGEAMSAGCVPVVINKGGQPEIVRSMVDGFLWDTVEELKEYTITLISNESLWRKISQASVKRAREFSMDRFGERVEQVLIE